MVNYIRKYGASPVEQVPSKVDSTQKDFMEDTTVRLAGNIYHPE